MNTAPSLMARAERLCTVGGRQAERLSWMPREIFQRFENPIWLSSRTLLAHTRYGDGFFVDPYQLDVRTGQVVRLDGAAKHINTLRVNRWRLSPDRRWLLYARGRGDDVMVALTLDGRRVECWPLPKPQEQVEYLWLPGSHRFLALWSGRDSPDRPTRVREYAIGERNPRWERPLPTLEATEFLGYAHDGGALFASYWDADRTGEIVLANLALPDARKVRHWRVKVGKISSIAHGPTLTLSPDGRRLAFESDNALWTVGVTGEGLRCLGAVDENEYSGLQAAGWQPGTNRLTFYWNKSLYRL